MKQSNRLYTVLATIITPLTLSACDNEFTGEQGELDFIRNKPSSPIAVGATLNISLTPKGGEGDPPFANGPVTVKSASSSAPDIIEVLSFEESAIPVKALKAGSTTLTVVAEGSDGILTDSITLEARDAEVVKLDHLGLDCKGLYIHNSRMNLEMLLQLKDSTPLSGVNFYPVEFNQPLIEIDPVNPPDSLDLNLGDFTGMVKVTSPLDPSLDFNFEVIASHQIDKTELNRTDEDNGTPLAAGQSGTYTLTPSKDGKTVCNQEAIETGVISLTPSICELQGNSLSFEIQGIAPGDCRLSFPLFTKQEGNDMTVLTQEVSVKIVAK